MSAPIKVLIVDDEPLARDTLRMLLEDIEDIDLVDEAPNGAVAVEKIAEHNPDLVFLDIQMPGMGGFDVIEEVGASNMPYVIFATAYDEYALKAFRANALDYLLKPFDDDLFEQALDRARTRLKQDRVDDLTDRLESLLAGRGSGGGESSDPDGTSTANRILVRDRDRIRFVSIDEINWIEAAGDYVVLHTDNKRHLIRATMTGMTKRLPRDRFARIHRSTIVNMDVVREVRPYFHGDYMVYMNDGKELRLSRRYWPHVEEQFNAVR
ncbi:MAG: response regulator transcription factor [Rhodothermales bacterium]|nr:response regulator transcription factor [Rhodothermales bacterium]MBO6780405.1 response regulator transcription factor [Rhodothermales bacterium]